eukprot:6212246-Pleurochrysis_carterae.AAC.3
MSLHNTWLRAAHVHPTTVQLHARKAAARAAARLGRVVFVLPMVTHLQHCGALQLDVALTCGLCDGSAAHMCVRMWHTYKCVCSVRDGATEQAAYQVSARKPQTAACQSKDCNH